MFAEQTFGAVSEIWRPLVHRRGQTFSQLNSSKACSGHKWHVQIVD